MFKWSEKDLANLIQKVIMGIKNDPSNFEKPSPEIFYRRYCSIGKLAHIKDYKVMQMKMRELRQKYLETEKIIKESEKDGMNLKLIKAALLKRSPHHNELHILFKHHLGNGHVESPLPGGVQVKTEVDEEHQENTTTRPHRNEHSRVGRKRQTNRVYLEPSRTRKDVDLMKFQIYMREKRLEFEEEKLRLEKTLAKRREMLRKYELDKQMEIRRLEKEMHERLQKYELELQQKSSSN